MVVLPNTGGALCSTPHPLFNAAVSLTPTTRCRAVTLPRRETLWNLQGCLKLPDLLYPLLDGNVSGGASKLLYSLLDGNMSGGARRHGGRRRVGSREGSAVWRIWSSTTDHWRFRIGKQLVCFTSYSCFCFHKYICIIYIRIITVWRQRRWHR